MWTHERADGARIVACHNALAGLNPEKVPALVEAAERLTHAMRMFHEAVYPTGHDGATCSSCEALAVADAALEKVKA